MPALPWARWAALAHRELGDVDAAAERAAEDLQAARVWQAPGPLGAALRVTAIVGPAEQRLDALHEAEGMLSGSSARLERARTLVELGAEMRRRLRQAAREPLADALEIADRCGAAVRARCAREELLATGARPRRFRRWGLDSLTASELRVARLAAHGKRNREMIAQALFVTPKTVEVHLSRCYRKLDVSGREQLAEALEAEQAGAASTSKT